MTTPFVPLAQARGAALGTRPVPMVVLPHPFETLPHDEIRRIAHERAPELVDLMVARMAEAAAKRSVPAS